MSESSAPSPAPSPAHTRAIRSYAQREDAERARALLAENDIESSIREFRVPDPVTGKPVSRGCSLFIDPAQAATAARLLLKMPPSDAPAASTAQPAGPTRLRRRSSAPVKQKGSGFIIAFAVICAAGMIIFAATGLFGPRRTGEPQSRLNQLLEEDLNGDTLPDVVREFTWDWIPIYHEEDRNFDSMMDLRWTWQRGKPAYRELDLNFDGKYDERTTYDPEGQPFYTDTRPGAAGPVLVRKVLREGLLWKMIEDRDADSYFDHITEFNDYAEIVREEALPKDSAENNPPPWPPPPWPVRPDDMPTATMDVKPGG